MMAELQDLKKHLSSVMGDLKSIGAESIIDALMQQHKKIETLNSEKEELNLYVQNLERRIETMEDLIQNAQREGRI